MKKTKGIKLFVKPVFLIAILLIAFFVTDVSAVSSKDKLEKEKSLKLNKTNSEPKVLEKIVFVHEAKKIKPDKKVKDDCYKLFSAAWPSVPLNYTINPTNTQGLTEEFVTSAFSSAAETWDDATKVELFNDQYTIDYSAHYGVIDSKNTLEFRDYPSYSVIAKTSIWFYRSENRIVEFDQIYNTRFNWGNATETSSVMDLQSIATHELGHAIGLLDIYSSECSDVTMYGYSVYGDTSKSTLEKADKNGLKEIYEEKEVKVKKAKK